MTAQTAADLCAAADLLEHEGWTQGNFHKRTGDKSFCHCAEGAIAVVTGDHVAVRVDANGRVDYDLGDFDGPSQGRRETAVAALAAHLSISQYWVPRWNDAETRTASEVIAAMREAADATKAKS